MSYTALITDQFDIELDFYENMLGFLRESSWDRPNGRGARLSLYGLRIELLDNQRQKIPFTLGALSRRIYLTLEVDNLQLAREALGMQAPPIQSTSWGARMFEVVDPDGVYIAFIEWTEKISDV